MMRVSSDKPPESEQFVGNERFSVIVPVFEQWALVPNLLCCLRAQTLSKNCFEVILVDNGSSEMKVPAELDSNVKVMKCATPGSYAARNFGAAHSQADWLVFTDADCQPSSNWLRLIGQTCTYKGDRALIAGSVEVFSPAARPNPWEIYDMIRGIPQEQYVRRGYAATANLAIPRAVFARLGGFDIRRFSGGDADLCRRARAKGYGILFVRDAKVEHPARATWDEISTKARRIKGGQLTAGSLMRRLSWGFRTLFPPVRGGWRFLTTNSYPVRYRLTAVLVLLQIWFVEVEELFRLCAGAGAERR